MLTSSPEYLRNSLITKFLLSFKINFFLLSLALKRGIALTYNQKPVKAAIEPLRPSVHFFKVVTFDSSIAFLIFGKYSSVNLGPVNFDKDKTGQDGSSKDWTAFLGNNLIKICFSKVGLWPIKTTSSILSLELI